MDLAYNPVLPHYVSLQCNETEYPKFTYSAQGLLPGEGPRGWQSPRKEKF